jgi:hypothetical protein
MDMQTPRFARPRTRHGLIAVGVALALAGCGGSSNQTVQRQAELPQALASDLADRSDAVADALDAGDECKAAHLADELKNAVEAALASGDVPTEFEAELERNATDLQNDVNCPEKKDEEHGKEDNKGQDTKGETTTLGTTLGTTTG